MKQRRLASGSDEGSVSSALSSIQMNSTSTSSLDRGRELTGQMILSLSELITSEENLLKLAIHGLKVEECVVEKEMTNNNDITMAAYGVLKHWFKAQRDKTTAHALLCCALRNVSLSRFINEALI